MTEILLLEKSSAEISVIVAELKAAGLKTGVDFDFAYQSGKYDWANLTRQPRQTLFTFYNDREAILFSLKWC